MSDLITCPTCSGNGRVQLDSLHPDLARTLAFVRRARHCTAATAAAALDPSGNFVPSTFNNRLEKLRKYGLLRREGKDGKAWIYKPEVRTDG